MHYLKTASALCLTFALPLAVPATCLGQQSSLFSSGSSSGSGSRSSSGQSSGSTMGGSSGGGTGSTSGQRGSGGSGTSGSGGVQQPQLNQFGSVSDSIGQGSFVGRSDNAGRFVGQEQAGQQANQGSSGLGQMGGRSGSGNQNGNNGGGNNANQSKRTVRPQLKVAFSVNRVPTTVIASSLQQRMSRETLTVGTLENVQLNMSDEGVVVLRGSVASQEARSLAAAMVRLEPGVRKVVNELTVQE